MIKLVIFDLDGVLVESRELHYDALNDALREIDPKYVIQRDEHLSRYDGNTTSKKLRMLTEDKGLPEELYSQVWERKQFFTRVWIEERITPNHSAIKTITQLRGFGIKVVVASNTIRDNVRLFLHKLGLLHLVDHYYSNEDVDHPKPHGQIYIRAMFENGVNATETLIIEDSHIGRTAALNSGAHLCAVRNPSDVTLEYIQSHFNKVALQHRPKWKGGSMNVLIPMAGAGSRFAQAGYTFPKPLIEVHGKPMIQLVVENLNIEARYIYIVQEEHYKKYNLGQMLRLITPDCEIVRVNGLTEGAACTTLLAKQFIDTDEPLVIANSDQFIEWNSNEFMYSMIGDSVDGGILTFTSTHPKWSFAKVGVDGFVTEVAEKNPISENATVGVYYWKRGSDYVKYAEQMIKKDIRTNNEFYVCPVYNQAIEDGKRIKIFPVPAMYSMGTPEDLQNNMIKINEIHKK